MSKSMLKNCWYVAALSDEVQENLFERTIIGQSILLFREKGGKPVAIANACPHRYAPLSMGKLKDGIVECAYHGLKFNSKGQCVHNPHGRGEIPKKACVESYPVVERHSLLWLWLGDPDKADELTIPDFSCLDDDGFVTVKGVIEMSGNYELVTDNLMDLTHVEYVHEGILGSEAISRGQHEIHQAGTTVWSNRWCPEGKAPPAWSVAFDNYQDDVDHWLNMRWDAPAHMLLDVGVAPTGERRDAGRYVYGTDILTPKDDKTTWYFWGISRNYKLDDKEVCKMWTDSISFAFGQQDKPIIEAQQNSLFSMGAIDIDDLDPVLLPTDSGPMRVRRILNLLRQGEEEGMVPDPQNPSIKELRKNKSEKEDDRIVAVV